MNSTVDLLKRAAQALNAGSVRYLIGGSVASMHYGEPRLTLDIDIVVFLRYGDIATLERTFQAPEFYLDRQMILDAMEREAQFNVLQPATGLEIDFMCVELEGHNRQQFERARRVDVEGTPVWFAAPEDIILKKLQYYQEDGSEKHLRDIASMIRTSGDQMDRMYLADWAARLRVSTEWSALKARVGW